MQTRNKTYTAQTLEEVSKYKGATEYVIIRELCAVYDHFCDCPSTMEQRLYLTKRIDHYKLQIFLKYEQAEN